MSSLVAVAIGNHGADAASHATPARLARLRAFHTLDALRGVAALSVVLFHVAFIYHLARPAEGQIAVDLFFVMSGFIIAYRYDDALRRGLSTARFIEIRLVRLYPLFILGTILGVLPAMLAVAGGGNDAFHRGLVESFPFAIFMLPSRYALPHMEELYPLNYVAWSLALEIVVNIIYAATFRFWTSRRLAIVIGIAFVGLCGCASHYGTLKYGYAWPQAPVGPVRIVYGFAMGVLIFRFYREKPFVSRVPWWALLVAALALFFFDIPFCKPAWELLSVAVLVPLIVIGAVASEPPEALRSTCALAGIMSYVVYSLHAPFVGLFLRAEYVLHADLQRQSATDAFAFSMLLVAACVSAHLFYDKPVRRLLTRRMAMNVTAPSATPQNR